MWFKSSKILYGKDTRIINFIVLTVIYVCLLQYFILGYNIVTINFTVGVIMRKSNERDIKQICKMAVSIVLVVAFTL